MKYYLAPMEGITGYIYRNAYAKSFHNIDKYFTPFIVPNESKSLKTKEFKDMLPENNRGLNIIPQILTDDAEGFIFTCKKLKQLGYDEVNLKNYNLQQQQPPSKSHAVESRERRCTQTLLYRRSIGCFQETLNSNC